MPRLARLDAPGALHHAMGRGIERKEIFYSDTDRSDFIDRLAVLVDEGALNVYAWVLMPNHFHLLCKTRYRPLSSSMRKILTGSISWIAVRELGYSGADVARYLGVTNSCVTRFIASGKKPDVDDLIGKL